MDGALTKLFENNLKIDKINDRLARIGNILLEPNDIKKVVPKYAGFVYDDSIEICTLYQSEDATVTHGVWHKKGFEYPNHCHECSVEHLIPLKGSFSVAYCGTRTTIRKGDYLIIPVGEPHICVSLEDESEMLAICIPPEPAYSRQE